jgi:hypothetical protein
MTSMPDDMSGLQATLLLCDAAQADPSGKVHILGAGWSITQAAPGNPLPPHAVVAIIHVPWNEANRVHIARLMLQDADGRIVQIETPNGTVPLIHEQQFEVGRPAGVPEGISLESPVVVNIGPGLPLPAGRYAWRLEIDERTRQEWVVPFHVRAAG